MVTVIRVSPSTAVSPAWRTVRVTLSPPTSTPLLEPRSEISTVSVMWTRAWILLTSGSLRRTAFSRARPIVVLPDGSVNSRPASGPAVTRKTAADSEPRVVRRVRAETIRTTSPDLRPLSPTRSNGSSASSDPPHRTKVGASTDAGDRGSTRRSSAATCPTGAWPSQSTTMSSLGPP